VSLSWPERLRAFRQRLRETRRRTGFARLRIGVAPDRLLVAAYSGRLHSVLTAAEAIAVNGGDVAPWRAAVEALPAALAPHASGKSQVSLVLSNHFARYSLLPSDPALRTEEEWLAYARHRLESVHGHAVAEWEVRVAETSRGGPRLACGIDRALLEAASARVGEAGAILMSVQPYLMAAFNRVCARLVGRTCWLVVAEPGRLALVLMRDGSWQSVRCRKADENWRQRLPEILARESAALALDQPCTDVVAMTPEALDADPAGNLRIRDLTLPRGVSQAHQSLAMVLP
jgi:hypothetical protein